ncbi:MAG TPA: hypothetical protein VG738_09575 [Chitinophagaceae bacterium]|nr:hypothetical protein [Chitinophagaceae bacterium]
MKQQDYHNGFTANIAVADAIDCINRVPDWWATDIEGSSEKLGDVFTVHFGETFVTFKIVETGANKVVWLVTDCHLPWLADQKEWNGTKPTFELSADGGSTMLHFTHVGLTPAVECYESCEKGWNFYISESLFRLMTEGKGQPNVPKAARAAVA